MTNFEVWYEENFDTSLEPRDEVDEKIAPRKTEEEIAAEVDPDALSYIRARKNVSDLHKAKKYERTHRI